MGSSTGASPSRPGRRIAYSTRSWVSGRTAALTTYWRSASISDSSAPSCTSPQMPRDLTLVSTFFRSPTPVASERISPRPLYTCSRRSLTSEKLSPRRLLSVLCRFSSTVLRISSSFTLVSLRISPIVLNSVSRMRSSFKSLAVRRSLSTSDTWRRRSSWLIACWS